MHEWRGGSRKTAEQKRRRLVDRRSNAHGLKARDVIARPEGPGTRPWQSYQALQGRNHGACAGRVALAGLGFIAGVVPGPSGRLSHDGLSALTATHRTLNTGCHTAGCKMVRMPCLSRICRPFADQNYCAELDKFVARRPRRWRRLRCAICFSFAPFAFFARPSTGFHSAIRV